MKKRTKFKKIVKRLLNNWALKLFSLVAAFLLWLLVIDMDDPEGEKMFYNIPVRLVNTEVLTDEDLVYEVLDKTDTVNRVTVLASKTIRDELASSDIVAEADFQNLTVTNTVEIRFYSLRYNEQISDISGSTEILKLSIEEKKTKRLSLTVNTTGEVAEDYIIHDITLDQNRIEVSGPESLIDSIVSAGVTVDVTDSNSNISTYSEVKLYDASGNEIPLDNLTMNADSVRVNVDIYATKDVPIQYAVMGVPASGYLFTGVIESSPDSVTIAGTAETLAGVSEITVPEDVLNITGQAEDMTVNVNLEDYLPEGVIFTESFSGRARVTVHIEEAQTRELHISADHLRFTNVPSGWQVSLLGESSSYALSIRGLAEEVSAVDTSLLYGYIDMTAFMESQDWNEMRAGEYEAEVNFTFAESITASQPLKVHISITEMEE